MEIIVTAADVYSALDAERPTGSIARIGGGAYRLQIDGAATEHESYDEAIKAAEADVDVRESDPSGEVKKLQARIVVLEARLRDAGVELAELALPVEVKG